MDWKEEEEEEVQAVYRLALITPNEKVTALLRQVSAVQDRRASSLSVRLALLTSERSDFKR